MKQPTKQTPLQKLSADKEQIRQQCRQQELKLNEGMIYLQDNAAGLLISGVSALLFPGSGKTAKKDKVALPSAHSQATASLGLSDFLTIGKTMVPVLWDIAQPFIITWCIRKIKKIISNAFTGKTTNKEQTALNP